MAPPPTLTPLDGDLSNSDKIEAILHGQLSTNHSANGQPPVSIGGRINHQTIRGDKPPLPPPDSDSTVLRFFAACAAGDARQALVALRSGADPAAQNRSGDTALHVVCRRRQPTEQAVRLVRLLAAWGAPLQAVGGGGLTPVQQAAAAGNTAALITLAETGAACDGLDPHGNTVLHLAVSSGNPQTVSAALDRLPADAVCPVNDVGRTPLQLAKNRQTARLLLAAGARADESTSLTLLQSVPSAVPDVLNHYVTTNGKPLDSWQLEVYLDYTPFWDKQRRAPAPETGLLRAIVDADRDELLKHPLVETFMHVKWLQIRRFFLLNFAFYVCFALLVTAYGMLRIIHPDETPTQVVGCLAATFTVLTAFREVFQMTYGLRLYVSSVDNWLELMVIALTTALLVARDARHAWVHHAVAWLMLATWLELTLMFGRLPTIGIYIYMFVRVAQKLIGFLLVYSPLLVAFALSFRVLFGETEAFNNIPMALIKTFIMMMGEYEYNSIFIDDSPVYMGTSHLLMVMFVVSMPIITVNLLIGLTVNDIQSIFVTAGVERLRITVIQILYIESIVYSTILHKLCCTRFYQRQLGKLTVLPKLLFNVVDKSQSRQPAAKNEKPASSSLPPASPESEQGCKEATATDPGQHIMRAGFRPNARAKPRLYRADTSGGLEPSPFVMHSWMLQNMLRLLQEREANEEQEQREQLLQAQILADIRAKAAEPAPPADRPSAAEQEDEQTASGRQTTASVQGDGEGVGDRPQTAAASQDALDRLEQTLSTVLTTVSEVALKVAGLERRLNSHDKPKLDAFYPA